MIEQTVGQVAATLGGVVEGRADKRLLGVAPLEAAGPQELSWVVSSKYKEAFQASRAGAVIVASNFEAPTQTVLIRVDNPELAFALAAQLFIEPQDHPGKVCAGALVDPRAEVAEGATVYPLAYVGPEAVIGPGAVIHPLAYIGPKARVGPRTVIHPQAALLERVEVGADCLIQTGAKIGADGFGFAQREDGSHVKIPQQGTVIIGDRVEIGANTAVDRATFGATVIGDGCKLDNLVQVAHNVTIGPNCALAGQVGVSGSVTMGQGCTLAGQVGLRDHISLGDRVVLAGGSGVAEDIPSNQIWAGYPALPVTQTLRIVKAVPKLPDLLRQVRDMEKRLAVLEGESGRSKGE